MYSSSFPTACFFSVLLIILHFQGCNGKNREGKDFLRTCPISHCGSGSLEIRFPFRLNTSPPSCGLEGFELTCSGDDPLLSLPSSPHPFKVTYIDYLNRMLTIGAGSEPICPPQNLTHLGSPNFATYSIKVSLLSCSTKFVPGSDSIYDRIAGPIPCAYGHNDDGYVYAAAEYAEASVLPHDCMVVSTDAEIPILSGDGYGMPLGDTMDLFMARREFPISWWKGTSGDFYGCGFCEDSGKWCGFSWERQLSQHLQSGQH